jgi:DNA repair and recombination protein RAD52
MWRLSVFDNEQIEMLAAALPGFLVKQRQSFSYIEGHEAMRACNRIFGFGNWQRNEPSYQRVMDDVYGTEAKPMYRVGYTCKLSVTIWNRARSEAITTWGTGYGEQSTGENAGKAHEGAIKEAETDAMKRALIALGDQFGLALYDKEQKHVDRGQQPQRAAQPAPRGDSAPQATNGKPSDKQRNYIKSLQDEIGWNNDRLIEEAHAQGINTAQMTAHDASKLIKHLQGVAGGVR